LEPFFQISDPIIDTGHGSTSSRMMAGILAHARRPIRPATDQKTSDPGSWTRSMVPDHGLGP
ncbi:MAG: hypothetical protein LM550_14055, partial [Candidatus Contendobacter sp.]|nr:hypothetical protein [Candidatus Contendobacter sp.]